VNQFGLDGSRFLLGMRPPVSGLTIRGVRPIPPEGSALGVLVGGWYVPPPEEPLPEVFPLLLPPLLPEVVELVLLRG